MKMFFFSPHFVCAFGNGFRERTETNLKGYRKEERKITTTE